MKFLLDENVKKELLKFLKQQGFEASFKPKKLSNGMLAEFSKSEQSVLITNDHHFDDPSKFPKEKIFSVVWLRRIPQSKPELLISAFSKLLDENPSENFEGRLIKLYPDRFEISELE